MNIENNINGVKDYNKSESSIMDFVKLENTYEKLIKNKEYLKIKEEIISNRDRLIYAFNSYDKGVISYNNYRKRKKGMRR